MSEILARLAWENRRLLALVDAGCSLAEAEAWLELAYDEDRLHLTDVIHHE